MKRFQKSSSKTFPPHKKCYAMHVVSFWKRPILSIRIIGLILSLNLVSCYCGPICYQVMIKTKQDSAFGFTIYSSHPNESILQELADSHHTKLHVESDQPLYSVFNGRGQTIAEVAIRAEKPSHNQQEDPQAVVTTDIQKRKLKQYIRYSSGIDMQPKQGAAIFIRVTIQGTTQSWKLAPQDPLYQHIQDLLINLVGPCVPIDFRKPANDLCIHIATKDFYTDWSRGRGTIQIFEGQQAIPIYQDRLSWQLENT